MAEKKPVPRAKDFLNEAIHTVSPEMTLADVIKFLLHHGISNVPVVEEEGGHRILVGFISELDCLDYLSNEAFYGSPAMPQTAGTIMKKHPVCITPDIDLFTLVSVFVSHGHRHLPVVEDHGLLGIVSRRDALRALDAHYRDAIKSHDREHFPPDLREIAHHRFIVSGR